MRRVLSKSAAKRCTESGAVTRDFSKRGSPWGALKTSRVGLYWRSLKALHCGSWLEMTYESPHAHVSSGSVAAEPVL